MKRFLFLVAAASCLASCRAAPTPAPSLGTLTDDKRSIDVAGTVVILDPSGPSIRFYLLPFVPTAKETANLQANERQWLLNKPSPDAARWKTCPYGFFELGWQEGAVGDPKKAVVTVYSSLSKVEFSTYGTTMDITLTGAVKEGETVSLTAKGNARNFDLDLKLKGKILTQTKNQ
jgi:hypothetical protein